jgi:hypothetical protein
VLAVQLYCSKPSPLFIQCPNNLLFAETALHRLSPQLENRLTSNAGLFREAAQSGNQGRMRPEIHRRSLPKNPR